MFQSTSFVPISLLEMPYPEVFGVTDNESKTRLSKFKMADPIRQSLHLKMQIGLRFHSNMAVILIKKLFQFLYNSLSLS